MERERPFLGSTTVSSSALGEPGCDDLFYAEKVRQSVAGYLQLMNKCAGQSMYSKLVPALKMTSALQLLGEGIIISSILEAAVE